MSWYTVSSDFDDMFWDSPEELAKWHQERKQKIEQQNKRGILIDEQTVKSGSFVLNLFRGFDGVDAMSNGDGTYTMKGEGGDQDVIWFAHGLFSKDYLHYADRGDFLLRYPIEVGVYKVLKTYEDGSVEESPANLGDELKNSRGYGKFLLPEGFEFSYKMQKFIISKKPIVFTRDMVTVRQEDDDFDELV